MKKTTLITALFLLMGQALWAQEMHFGIHGSMRATWLLNNNVNDQGPNLNPEPAFAPAAGLSATYMLMEQLGLSINLNWARIDQKYNGDQNNISYEAHTKTRWIDVPLLLSLQTSGGFYFELGPQWSFLSKATETLTSSSTVSFTPYENKTFTDNFRKSLVSGIFGFGGRFALSDAFLLVAGLRFQYGFNDAVKELSEAEYFSALIDGTLSVPAIFAHIDQQSNYSYEKTTPLSGGVLLGLSYRLGNKR